MSATRIRVHTLSGSTYVFDANEMTWERLNKNVGHEDIKFFQPQDNILHEPFPKPIVGERMNFFANEFGDPASIITTPVVLVEDIS